MDLARELMRARYFSKLKQTSELFVGIELELPIVHLDGTAVDFRVVHGLFDTILEELPFSIEKTDASGKAIQLISDETEDRILFEVGYNTLEFAFDKAKTIGEVASRFKIYLAVIQPYLRTHHYLLTGLGVNPFWHQNDNRPVASPRYELLMAYLKLGQEREDVTVTHHDYGAFIQGSQVQLDVTSENLLATLNAFNAIEPIKAWLFANSYFWQGQLETLISRDIFWEDSMHGIFPRNVGVFPRAFETEADFLDSLMQTAMFTSRFENTSYYFQPIQVSDYFHHDEISAIDLSGQSAILSPSPYDFEMHRAYQYQSLTTRGTVEFRSVCAQPLSDSFTVAAFHLGLMCQLSELESLILDHPFYEDYGRDYPILRRRFAAIALPEEALDDVILVARDLLDLASQGLKTRGFGEEEYLSPLYQRLAVRENPGHQGLRRLQEGHTLSEIAEYFAREANI